MDEQELTVIAEKIYEQKVALIIAKSALLHAWSALYQAQFETMDGGECLVCDAPTHSTHATDCPSDLCRRGIIDIHEIAEMIGLPGLIDDAAVEAIHKESRRLRGLNY